MEIRPASMDTGTAGTVMAIAPGRGLPANKNEQTPGTTSPAESPSPEQIKQMTKELNEHVNSMSISLNFTPYGDHNEKIAVIVSDKKTGEVIREIPPKQLQELYVKMGELIGIIFNDRI